MRHVLDYRSVLFVKRLVLARHAESELQRRGTSSTATPRCGAADGGGAGAGARAGRARHGPLDLSRHASSSARGETADLALAAGRAALVFPELNDIRFGRYEGRAGRRLPRLGARGAARRTTSRAAARAGLRGRGATRAAIGSLLERPEEPRRARRPTVLRALPAAGARGGVHAACARLEPRAARASRSAVDVRASSRAQSTCSRRWAASRPPSRAHCERCCHARRVAHPRARPDRARRRGDLPRLRRRRLDLPLARARRARLPRLRAARGPRPARRRVGRGRALLPRGARRRGRRRAGSDRGRAARASATRSRPTGSARPATPPPTRSRRCCSASSRAAAPQRIKPRREDGVVRPLLGALARGDARPTAASTGCRYRDDSSNRGHEARPDPQPRSCRCWSASTRVRARACSRSRTSGRGCRGRSSARSPSCSPRRAARRRADLGGGVRAVREYDRLRLEGAVDAGGPGRRVGRRRARGPRPAAGRPARGPSQEGAGSVRGRQGAARGARRLAARRARRRGRRRARASPRPPAWEGVVSTMESGRSERGRRDPDRRGARCRRGSRELGRGDLDATTRAATCCSSACSRAPSSSWPT